MTIGVGKSCLLARIMDNDFKIEHQVTIGVEFGSFVFTVDEKPLKGARTTLRQISLNTKPLFVLLPLC